MLLGAAAAVVEAHAHAFQLDLVPADADAQAQASAGEQVNLGGLLGDQGRLALRQDDDAVKSSMRSVTAAAQAKKVRISWKECWLV